MENHITNKCGFFALEYVMVAEYAEKKSHTRGRRDRLYIPLGMAFYLFDFSGGIYSKRSFKSQSKA